MSMRRTRSIVILLGCAGALSLAAAAARPAGGWGALPDDDKDDAAAINRALAEAQPGDTVTLPEGTFLLSEPLQVKSGLTLEGAGQEKTRLVFSGVKPHALIGLHSVTQAVICHLTVDGLNNPKASQGLVGSRCAALSLHHLTVQNFVDTGGFGPHGILLSATSDSVISDNTIRNIAPEDEWGAGLRVGDKSVRNVIARNVIDNTGRGGIFTNNGASDAVIRENVVTRSGGIGFAIEVHSGSDRTLVEDNVVDHGLSIVSERCAVRRNIVTDAGGSWKAYGIEGGGGPYGIVTDNIIHYGQIEGISLSGFSHHMLWAYNQFVCCSMWGMQIQGPSESNRINTLYFYNNTFSRTLRGHPSVPYKGADGHAVRINNHASHLTFDSNRFTDNGGQAFQILGRDVNCLTFVNNVIANNASASIRDYPGDTVVWENNRVVGNKTNAVLESRGDLGNRPAASFSAPDRARSGEPVVFKNTSTDADAVTQVLWDFGDGLPCTELSPAHTYQRPGVYRVNLLVWNRRDNVARAAERTIWVEGP